MINCDLHLNYVLCKVGNYVGETGPCFCLHFSNHKKSIQNKFAQFSTFGQFDRPSYTFKALKCVLFTSDFISFTELYTEQFDWIFFVLSHITCLNQDLGPLNNYQFHKHI